MRFDKQHFRKRKNGDSVILTAAALLLAFACLTLVYYYSDANSEYSDQGDIVMSGSAETTADTAESGGADSGETTFGPETDDHQNAIDYPSFADYNGEPYAILNGNRPRFTDDELTTVSYEKYEDLDDLGRAGVCEACVGRDIMPTEPRGRLGSVKPSGWQTVKYDIVAGRYLYNRCHLIGYQLTGENSNVNNLITGTRYMNTQGMLPFENMVADYVKETGNHVMYRVTPVFEGDDLLAGGVCIEAYSVEDGGAGICFNVFCYNVQPGIVIDYSNGDNWLEDVP